MPVREARAAYYRAHGLPHDGGIEAPTVRYPIGRWHLVLPNVAARRRALPLHDLNHLATGYATDWYGEAEIGAWELGSGCGNYALVWVLATVAFSIGLLIAPVRTWRAFLRGRRSGSLFRGRESDRWLAMTVGELRASLRVDEPLSRATVSDIVGFGLFCLPLGGLLVLGWLVAAWLSGPP